MTMRLLSRALDIAEWGWFVFPLRPGDKRPLPGFTSWETRATRRPEQITHWWIEAPYNIGIATGPSGLLVIDCDASEDSPQWRLVGEDVEIAGKALPKTLSVATPNGGRHLYFSAKGRSIGNTAGRLGRRIDTRGNGALRI